MWRRSAQPPSIPPVRRDCGAALCRLAPRRGVGWVLIGYVAVNLIGVVIRTLNTTSGDRADRAAVPEIVRRARRRIPAHRAGAQGSVACRNRCSAYAMAAGRFPAVRSSIGNGTYRAPSSAARKTLASWSVLCQVEAWHGAVPDHRLAMTEAENLNLQEERIRHADTQVAGIMTLTATGAGLLAAGNGFRLVSPTKEIVAVALLSAFAFATLARLADILPPKLLSGFAILPMVTKPSDGSPDADSAQVRAEVAGRKGALIAYSLLAVLLSVVMASVSVF
jgi:hypothetical protein